MLSMQALAPTTESDLGNAEFRAIRLEGDFAGYAPRGLSRKYGSTGPRTLIVSGLP
jgi:hypothetical protein